MSTLADSGYRTIHHARMAYRPEQATTSRSVASRAVTIAVLLMAVAWAACFITLAILRYNHFDMHALDMGNMEQAVWNTAHGRPFAFNNLRQPWTVEASGTTTRLSFHVEPILLLVAIPYLLVASPLILIVVQALVVASGAVPAALLARRHLHSPLAQLVFPIAYLLAPALQAATLYEFHAVTMSAALLLWAFYFADGRQYRLFALFAILAMATKEEIGLVVAMMGLWIWWRRHDRAVGLATGALSLGWSLVAVLVIMHHFHPTYSSPYCARFNFEVTNGLTATHATSCTQVLKLWLNHPLDGLNSLVSTPKLGFVHRTLMPTGYLALLNPLALLISLPSFVVILFSNDVHMYSGLGHYSAELVPITIAAAILGVAWLAFHLGPRLRLAPAAVVTVACLWLLVASVANTRVNGFSPLSAGFSPPQETEHVRIGQSILSLIPRDASVAAGDYLNAHLSDRAGIYLFPDIADARYAVVDVTKDRFPLSAQDEMSFIRDKMLATGEWGIVRADDGYLLMERRSYNPRLPTTLPAGFFTFVVPRTRPEIPHPLRVQFGPWRLLGYAVDRAEQVNVRQADVVLTTYWQLTQPLPAPDTPVVYLTNGTGALDVANADHPATAWLPTNRWPVGRTVVMRTSAMAVYAQRNGFADIDVAMYRPGGYDWLTDAVHRIPPAILQQPAGGQVEVVGGGGILKLTHVPVVW
ncbi:MAG TPA: DUF2079 domain-containing protein [Chloroflexota bacterium]|nr:DUF2079 domain-containing protein [Chloroflexota bacterium]